MKRCQECGKLDREATNLDQYCQYCATPYGPEPVHPSRVTPGPGPDYVTGVDGPRTVAAIAREIAALWKKPYFGAVPYLQAMRYLDRIDDRLPSVGSGNYRESGRSVVLYFLANAASWRGPDARRIKAELKGMLS
jgi:hypothetical protein